VLHQSVSVWSAEKSAIKKKYTNTRATVLDRLVRDREFPKVVADHLWLNFDRIEDLERAAVQHRRLSLGPTDGHTLPL
jgi:hypothetical protein